MIKTVKISKVNINEPKTGSTSGKDWKAWPVGICVDDVWHNAFLFDKDFVDKLGVSDGKEMTLDFYTEEYQGEDQNKFKQVTKNDIINIKLDEHLKRIEALEKRAFGKVTVEPEQKPEEPKQKSKFPPLVQAKWDEFDKCLEENKDIEKYKEVRTWLDGLNDPTTKVLTEQLSKLKESMKSGEYESYHEELITACCETLKTKDRLPVIQTLNNMVKGWNIEGTEKLSDASENECFNLLEQFDNQLKEEDSQNLPY